MRILFVHSSIKADAWLWKEGIFCQVGGKCTDKRDVARRVWLPAKEVKIREFCHSFSLHFLFPIVMRERYHFYARADICLVSQNVMPSLRLKDETTSISKMQRLQSSTSLTLPGRQAGNQAQPSIKKRLRSHFGPWRSHCNSY